jgi:hypothetical protein
MVNGEPAWGFKLEYICDGVNSLVLSEAIAGGHSGDASGKSLVLRCPTRNDSASASAAKLLSSAGPNLDVASQRSVCSGHGVFHAALDELFCECEAGYHGYECQYKGPAKPVPKPSQREMLHITVRIQMRDASTNKMIRADTCHRGPVPGTKAFDSIPNISVADSKAINVGPAVKSTPQYIVPGVLKEGDIFTREELDVGGWLTDNYDSITDNTGSANDSSVSGSSIQHASARLVFIASGNAIRPYESKAIFESYGFTQAPRRRISSSRLGPVRVGDPMPLNPLQGQLNESSLFRIGTSDKVWQYTAGQRSLYATPADCGLCTATVKQLKQATTNLCPELVSTQPSASREWLPVENVPSSTLLPLPENAMNMSTVATDLVEGDVIRVEGGRAKYVYSAETGSLQPAPALALVTKVVEGIKTGKPVIGIADEQRLFSSSGSSLTANQTLRQGMLFRMDGQGQVYRLENGTKRPFQADRYIQTYWDRSYYHAGTLYVGATDSIDPNLDVEVLGQLTPEEAAQNLADDAKKRKFSDPIKLPVSHTVWDAPNPSPAAPAALPPVKSMVQMTLSEMQKQLATLESALAEDVGKSMGLKGDNVKVVALKPQGADEVRAAKRASEYLEFKKKKIGIEDSSSCT